MEFGKIDSPEGIDFSLPDDDPANQKFRMGTRPIQGKLQLGLTGWGERAWVGGLYPQGTKTTDFLHQYSRSFGSVELNSTFYALPNEKTLELWLAYTPASFRFFPKVWRVISHRPDHGLSTQAGKDFIQMTHAMGSRYGGSFLQLPPGYSESKSKALLRFLDSWPQGPKLFLEFRDTRWLHDPVILHTLEKSGFGLVITDTPGRRDLLHMRLTTPRTIVRFVASGYREVDDKRILDWATRLNQWFLNGLEEAAFFCHQPDNRNAPELAQRCRSTFLTHTLSSISPIPEILDHEPRQGNLFASTC